MADTPKVSKADINDGPIPTDPPRQVPLISTRCGHMFYIDIFNSYWMTCQLASHTLVQYKTTAIQCISR